MADMKQKKKKSAPKPHQSKPTEGGDRVVYSSVKHEVEYTAVTNAWRIGRQGKKPPQP